jgi:hypothetical protein
MTDYQRCLEAADWRLERLEARLDETNAISAGYELNAERMRLGSFADFCMLAKEFDGGDHVDD